MSGSSARKLRRRDVDLLAGGEISYLRAPSGVETDFIWSRGDASIASELKSSARWQRQYSSELNLSRTSCSERRESRDPADPGVSAPALDGEKTVTKVPCLPPQQACSWQSRPWANTRPPPKSVKEATKLLILSESGNRSPGETSNAKRQPITPTRNSCDPESSRVSTTPALLL